MRCFAAAAMKLIATRMSNIAATADRRSKDMFRDVSSSCVEIGAQPARWARRITLVVKRREDDHGEEVEDVARIEHAFLDGFEMSHDAEGRDTASTNHGLAHCDEQIVTGGQPARIRKSESTTETMKLTTWLRVIAEVMAAIAR